MLMECRPDSEVQTAYFFQEWTLVETFDQAVVVAAKEQGDGQDFDPTPVSRTQTGCTNRI
jgi:hypothetical protein